MNPNITNNIMIDIEAFGKRPKGLIVSIGAVAFSTKPQDYEAGTIFSGKQTDQFYAVLSSEAVEYETRYARFNTTPSYLDWWKNDQAEAYAKLVAMMDESTFDMTGLMASFLRWLKPFCDQGYNIVGNSPSFDLVIIENACDVTGQTFPVPYRAESDYRMLTDLVWGPENKPRPDKNDAHDALFDAKFQAEVYAQAIYTVGAWKQAATANRDEA